MTPRERRRRPSRTSTPGPEGPGCSRSRARRRSVSGPNLQHREQHVRMVELDLEPARNRRCDRNAQRLPGPERALDVVAVDVDLLARIGADDEHDFAALLDLRPLDAATWLAAVDDDHDLQRLRRRGRARRRSRSRWRRRWRRDRRRLGRSSFRRRRRIRRRPRSRRARARSRRRRSGETSSSSHSSCRAARVPRGVGLRREERRRAPSRRAK